MYVATYHVDKQLTMGLTVPLVAMPLSTIHVLRKQLLDASSLRKLLY